jgi:predicted secreted acid phosphatase
MHISGRLGLPAVAATTAALALIVGGSAPAHARSVDDSTLTPKTTFTMTVNPYDGTTPAPASGADIPNIDSVKSTIRAYYAATKDPTSGLYVSSKTSSPYITQLGDIVDGILADLPETAPTDSAVVFDIDATLLSDFDFEEATHYNYDGTVAGQWVAGHLYPAVPGMTDLVSELVDRGYDVYGVTGRPASQEDDTIANLTEQGFVTSGDDPVFDNDNLFTTGSYTPAAKPAYVDCAADGNAASCSTVEKKAFTRQDIEDTLGDDVVLNVGDQWSDLMGGYAGATVKIPNPTYFLASLDISGAPASDIDMKPPSSYTMKPDGSSGATVASGDDIPNLDPLRKEIRDYYNAPSGLANRSTSKYITDLAGLQERWDAAIQRSCTAANTAITKAQKEIATTKAQLANARKRLAHAKTHRAKVAARKDVRRLERTLSGLQVPGKPAVVLDADDTTLWTYDMEDGAMKFNYDPALQDTWVQDERFAATPGMPELVADVADAGCTIFGLTGRNTGQKYATLGNLSKVGYSDFRANRYFTKWISGSQPPAYIDCGSDDTCSTIEYKSQTRKHIEAGGYDIVANLGDQFSDLIGGYADHVYKLPNPTYYLP